MSALYREYPFDVMFVMVFVGARPSPSTIGTPLPGKKFAASRSRMNSCSVRLYTKFVSIMLWNGSSRWIPTLNCLEYGVSSSLLITRPVRVMSSVGVVDDGAAT